MQFRKVYWLKNVHAQKKSLGTPKELSRKVPKKFTVKFLKELPKFVTKAITERVHKEIAG